MNAQLRRWGNSLAVRLPRTVVEAAKLREGDQLELVVSGPGKVQLKSAKANLSLAQLVRKITPQNRHKETDWGKPIGGELW